MNIGRRWGKSSFGFIYLLEKATLKPNTRYCFLAPVKDKLESYLNKVTEGILPFAPEGFEPEASAHGSVYTLPNGSTIECFGATNKSYLYIKGQKFNGSFLDEVGEMDDLQTVINAVISPTLFDSQGFMLIASAPGESPDHYFSELCKKAELGGYYKHFTIHDAGYPKEWIEQELKDVADGDPTDNNWRRQYLAEFVIATERAVLPEWDSKKFVYKIPRTDVYKYFHHFVAFDPGYKDPNSVTFATYLFGSSILYVEAEIVIPGKKITSDNLAEKIKAKVIELWGNPNDLEQKFEDIQNVHYWADPENQTLLDDLGRNYGLHFNWTAKDKKIQALENFRTFIKQGRLVLDPICAIHKTMFESTIWNKQHSEYERGASGFHGDCVDSTLYMFRNLVYDNPIPADYNFNSETHFSPRVHISDEEKNLGTIISSDLDPYDDRNEPSPDPSGIFYDD